MVTIKDTEAGPGPSERGPIKLRQQIRIRATAALHDLDTVLGLKDAPPGRMRLRTLSLIRWIAIIGQVFTILFVRYSLGLELPLLAMMPAVALSAAVNVVLAVRLKANTRLSERSAGILLSYDVAQLAYLLLLTGGLQNPFAILLVVPVTLAATTLALRTTVAVSTLVVLAATLLALWPGTLPWKPAGLELPILYVFGLWVSVVLSAVLIAGYGWRVAEDSRRLSDALTETQMALAREQQLSALGGLAAAAAHELGTPLATIAVTAKELARALPPDTPLAEDADELVAQAQRCRDILATFSRDHTTTEHEPFMRAPLSSLLESIAEERQRPGSASVRVSMAYSGDDALPEPVLTLTPEMRHALANLIDNALQFATSTVDISVRHAPNATEVVIADDGPGFAPDVLEWLGEPYVSTRREGGGHGLGVFIATTLLARTGATVHFDNSDTGARVRLSWPRRALERPAREFVNDSGERQSGTAAAGAHG